MENNFNTNVGTSLETTHTVDFSDRLYKVVLSVIALVGVAVIAWMVYQFNALPANIPHEISVSGEGRAFGKPDIAAVSFGMTSEAVKSQDAVNKNNEVMNEVIDAVKALGVKDEDIQTTAYNLSPLYDYTRGGTVFRGYQLSQQVSVKIRDFDRISDILDAATSHGANNVGGLDFRIDDPEKVQAEARAMAIEKAKEKLQNIMRESGLKVGKLVNISEGYNNYSQPMYGVGSAELKNSDSIAPQIQTGQQEVSSTVTLTYQVK